MTGGDFIDGDSIRYKCPTVDFVEFLSALFEPIKTPEEIEREQKIEKLKLEIKEKMAELEAIGGSL